MRGAKIEVKRRRPLGAAWIPGGDGWGIAQERKISDAMRAAVIALTDSLGQNPPPAAIRSNPMWSHRVERATPGMKPIVLA